MPNVTVPARVLSSSLRSYLTGPTLTLASAVSSSSPGLKPLTSAVAEPPGSMRSMGVGTAWRSALVLSTTSTGTLVSAASPTLVTDTENTSSSEPVRVTFPPEGSGQPATWTPQILRLRKVLGSSGADESDEEDEL